MSEGGSASRRAEDLRAEAAAARAKADFLEREAGAWQAGADGERRIGALLNALSSDWRVLHDRLLRPGRSATNLDHVLVGPAGVYLVDTKNWSGRLTLHDGTLWQHSGSSHRPQRGSMEQVARAAAEMERVLGLPVTPLIVLAGPAGANLRPCLLHGVEIVPAGQLQRWLSGQPPSSSVVEVDALAGRAAMAFPPAAPEDTPALLASESWAPPHQPPRRVPSPRRQPARRRRQRGAFWQLIFALAVLSAAPLVLPKVVGSVAERVQQSVRPGAHATDATTACSGVEARVAALLGGRAKADPNRAAGQCRWTRDTASRQGPTDVTVNLVKHSASQAMVSAQAGSAVVIVPEGQGLPEWNASTLTASQSFSIRLRYAYPANANRAQRKTADASALEQVIALSKELAGELSRSPVAKPPSMSAASALPPGTPPTAFSRSDSRSLDGPLPHNR
ncbi:MAG TPA: nuclease-related domain-containing protein [Propionibacteriaceae bacterium]